MDIQSGKTQHLIILVGPRYSGQTELVKSLKDRLGYISFHDDQVAEFVRQWLNPHEVGYWPLLSKIRREIFEATAASYHNGFVMAQEWDFSSPDMKDYFQSIIDLFKEKLWVVHVIELEASLGSRIRNMRQLFQQLDPNELEIMEAEIMEMDDFEYNSSNGIPLEVESLKLDTTRADPSNTVDQVIKAFNLT